MVRSYPWQVRSEGELVNDINEVCNAHELSFDIANLKTWIQEVELTYLHAVTLFHRTHLIDKNTRRKHWPGKSWTREEIVARSGDKRIGSIFFHEATPHLLESALQGIMGARFEEFLDKKYPSYFVDFIEPVGAARKRITRHVCFEIDYSTPACHAYPVLADEIPAEADVLEVIANNRTPYTKSINAGDVRIVDRAKEGH